MENESELEREKMKRKAMEKDRKKRSRGFSVKTNTVRQANHRLTIWLCFLFTRSSSIFFFFFFFYVQAAICSSSFSWIKMGERAYVSGWGWYFSTQTQWQKNHKPTIRLCFLFIQFPWSEARSHNLNKLISINGPADCVESRAAVSSNEDGLVLFSSFFCVCVCFSADEMIQVQEESSEFSIGY